MGIYILLVTKTLILPSCCLLSYKKIIETTTCKRTERALEKNLPTKMVIVKP